MFVVTEGTRVSCYNGYKLYTRSTLPEKQEPKAILVYLHGLGHHCSYLDKAFRLYAEQGIATYSYDHYSHGKSEPFDENSRCHMPDFEALVTDALDYAKQVKATYTDKGGRCPPIFIGGESLGALIAALAVRRDQQFFAGLVLVAPALDKQLNLVLKIQSMVAGLLAVLIPRARLVPAVNFDDLSEDKEVVEAYKRDPLTFVGNQRVAGMHYAFQALQGLKRHYKEYTLPVYALHGKRDSVTWSEGTKRFIEQVSSKNKVLRLLDTSSHILMDGNIMLENVTEIANWILETSKE